MSTSASCLNAYCKSGPGGQRGFAFKGAYCPTCWSGFQTGKWKKCERCISNFISADSTTNRVCTHCQKDKNPDQAATWCSNPDCESGEAPQGDAAYCQLCWQSIIEGKTAICPSQISEPYHRCWRLISRTRFCWVCYALYNNCKGCDSRYPEVNRDWNEPDYCVNCITPRCPTCKVFIPKNKAHLPCACTVPVERAKEEPKKETHAKPEEKDKSKDVTETPQATKQVDKEKKKDPVSATETPQSSVSTLSPISPPPSSTVSISPLSSMSASLTTDAVDAADTPLPPPAVAIIVQSSVEDRQQDRSMDQASLSGSASSTALSTVRALRLDDTPTSGTGRQGSAFFPRMALPATLHRLSPSPTHQFTLAGVTLTPISQAQTPISQAPPIPVHPTSPSSSFLSELTLIIQQRGSVALWQEYINLLAKHTAAGCTHLCSLHCGKAHT